MKIGNKAGISKDGIYQSCSGKSIKYAVNIIKNSIIAPYVKALYFDIKNIEIM